MLRNYYQVLGVQTSASPAEIQARYRVLAKKLHPDVNDGDADGEETLKTVNLAYRTLTDPKLRREYDARIGITSAAAKAESERQATRVSIARFPVVSTVFRTIGYDSEMRLLDVEFQKGSVFRYFDVPAHVYSELLRSEVKGQFYQKHIAGVYRERAMRR